MSRFSKLMSLAIVALCATVSFAATIEVVDRFGDPITDTDLVALVDGQRVFLGRSTDGTFDIDVAPGSTVIIVSAAASSHGKAEIEVPASIGTLSVTLPSLDRAACDPATNTPVVAPSTTAFANGGAGGAPGLNVPCGPAPLNPANDTVWFSVIGTGNEMVASTCNQAQFDTMIGVFCEGCANQTCVGSNDDSPGCAGFSSEFIWDSQAGAEYLIAVQGFFGATGAGDLTVADTGAPNQGQPVQCIQPGACCLPDRCEILTPGDCNAAGGTYLGDGTECSNLEGGSAFVSNPGLAIPDGGPAVSDTIVVPAGITIDDLDVDFITDHTFIGDLTISITSPSGPTVTLVTGGFAPELNLCELESGADVIFNDEGPDDFDDAVGPCGASPVVGNGPPLKGALSTFDAQDATGAWVITVTDENGLDTGSLLQWSLHFNAVEVSKCEGACCTDEPGVASDCIETTQDECERDNGLFVGGSCDDIDDCLPLHVEFDSVTATLTRAGVAIEWVTTTELDTAGFRVLRETGGREKTRSLVAYVPAMGFGLEGGTYSLLDEQGDEAVRYFIVEIDNSGRETVYGPFDVERPGRGGRVAK